MRKQTIALSLSALLLAGCQSSAGSSTKSLYQAGTYSATAPGRNGDVTLTVTFSEDAITDIKMESKETEGLGTTAMETLKEQVLSSQSVPSDVVSGATISSNAFMDALKNAVKQAGADPESLVKDTKTEAVEYQKEADIIVVGGGAAGMTAAVTAAENGASVILLEKSSTLGGNTLAAANGTNAADSKVQLADETYQSVGGSVDGLIEVQSQNDKARAELVEAFANNSGEVIDWISDLGVDFKVEISHDERNAVPNNYMLKAEGETSTAVAMVNAVKKALEASNVTLYTEVDATGLVTDENNTVTGVTAIDASGKEVTFSAKAVVLATGGFGQNSELVGKVNPDLANAITDEIAPTTGEGLLMAQAIGAKTVDLDQIQTFPSVIEGSGMFMSFGLWRSGDAISVNNEGKRYALEQFENVEAILSQEDGVVYGIFDQDNYNDSWSGLVGNGFMVKADSVEELADALGIDAKNLSETIEKWNQDAATGTDSEYGRENITTIDGTYYGYRYGVGAHYFMGGLLINADTQVLDEDEQPISGLYAAGEVTGGFHGTQRVDGSGIGDSFTFGRIAGRTAASAVTK